MIGTETELCFVFALFMLAAFIFSMSWTVSGEYWIWDVEKRGFVFSQLSHRHWLIWWMQLRSILPSWLTICHWPLLSHSMQYMIMSVSHRLCAGFFCIRLYGVHQILPMMAYMVCVVVFYSDWTWLCCCWECHVHTHS